jgi:PAN domain
LEKNPTGVLIGTLPWLSDLSSTDFPCCGVIKYCIPEKGCTNEVEFNLAGEGCKTASLKNCGSGQESPTQQASPLGSSDFITDYEVGISVPLGDQTQSSSDSGIKLEQNTDRPGMNYNSYATGSDPQICANDCANDPNCKAFTHVKTGFRGSNSQPECWLKDDIPDPVPQEYCVSGVK